MASKFIDSNISYVYPMANSLRGGAIASELNIRNLFNVLLSKSSAVSTDDFNPDISGSDDNSESDEIINLMPNDDSWFTMVEKSRDSKSKGVTTVNFTVTIPGGRGNCNGYYVSVSDIMSMSFDRSFNIVPDAPGLENDFTLYLYLRIIYSGTGICDGLYLWVGDDEDVNSELEKSKACGFYDIGIKLGQINVKLSNVGQLNESVYAVYIYNKNIMNCIDLDRLGNADGSFIDQLYNRLNRLYQLMIDKGAISIGTVLDLDFNPDPGKNNHDFEMISPYKAELYISPNFEEGEYYNDIKTEYTDSNGQISAKKSYNTRYKGGLRLMKRDANGVYEETYGEDILKFTTKSVKTGQTITVAKKDDSGNVIRNSDDNKIIIETIDEYVEVLESINILNDLFSFSIGSNGEGKFKTGDIEVENLTVNNDASIKNLTVTDNAYINNLAVHEQIRIYHPSNQTSNYVTIEVDANNILHVFSNVSSSEFKINLQEANSIIVNDVIANNISANEITADKVYGAVWQ